jgi:hypothetical protein
MNQWENSYLNTDFGRKILQKVFISYLCELLYDHLIAIYNLQTQNKRKHQKLRELRNITLQDLDVKEKLLLKVIRNLDSPIMLE